MATKRKLGRMILIGGAEDPNEDSMRILPYLVEIAGGRRCRMLVCSAPSKRPKEKARSYRDLFEKMGVAEVVEAPIRSRAEASSPDLLEIAKRATAVFLTGGDQLRLSALVAGTPLFSILRERVFEDGLVMAGTSAGAAALGGTMIIGGPEGGTVRRSDVDLAPGLGLWRETVIDTHFNQRGRVHRLLTIFALNPETMGIGIDENTAIELWPGERFAVIGSGAVMVFNGRTSYTNAPEAAADEILTLTDSVVHVLSEGYGFDLRSRRPMHRDGETIERVT